MLFDDVVEGEQHGRPYQTEATSGGGVRRAVAAADPGRPSFDPFPAVVLLFALLVRSRFR